MRALLVAAAGLLPLGPAMATRSIQIDVPSQRNQLTACSFAAVANCQYLDRSFGASVIGVQISQNGYIQLMDGRVGSANLFYVGQSDTTYTVLSGYTFLGGNRNDRIDFIDFYQPGADLTPNSAGNRPAPNFQVQLHNVTGRSGLTDLEVTFAYHSVYGNFTNVATGATIGYSGTTFSQTGTSITSEQRGPAQRFVTNADGLLLGESYPTDSDFSFIVGDYLLVQNGAGRDVTMGLVSQTFTPRYGAVTAPLPEPATWGLMLLGFGAAGAAMRRRGRIAATA